MTLPQNILEYISILDLSTYYYMLSIPSLARWSMIKQEWIKEQFVEFVSNNNYLVMYCVHRGKRKPLYHCIDKPFETQSTKEWYKNGVLHREKGPARQTLDGCSEWYKNGVLHRDNGPAIVLPSGTQIWYKNGKLHREDGPAIVRYKQNMGVITFYHDYYINDIFIMHCTNEEK